MMSRLSRWAKFVFSALAVGSVVVMPSVAAHAVGLTIGDPAPPIVVKAFVKGAPVDKLPEGKISVVEFWATWCEPCKDAIPHLTEMAKKYPKVTFIGVSVWEQDQKLVAPFVKAMGDKMDYHIAMDEVGAGDKGGRSGVMAKTWLDAAAQYGIPTAFVIGTDGKIAWIGHPMVMAKSLAKIIAGKWDVAAATSLIKKQQEFDEQTRVPATALQPEVQTALESKDPEKIRRVIADIDATIAKNPISESGSLGTMKYQLLSSAMPSEESRSYLRRLVTEVYKNDVQMLNVLCWPIIDPDAKTKPDSVTLALATQAAKQADSLCQYKVAEIADTFAAACFANGDIAGAVKAEQRAIRLTAPESGDVADMKKMLARYQSATAK